MSENQASPRIKITRNGPYIVTGGVPLIEMDIVSDRYGTAREYRETKRHPLKQTYSLCRCGKSRTKPFCDGTHTAAGFTCQETASREPFSSRAEVYEGPSLIMEDVEDLCALARFCHIGGNTWDLVEDSGNPESREQAILGACNCPAGRLVLYDAGSGKPIEYEYEPSICVLRDELTGAAGPLWVRGGIPIEAPDGFVYETRNRVTLCRCGKSRNMPFCNGMHMRL